MEGKTPKPWYLVFAPLGIVWGGSFVEVGLLAKWTGGLDPIVYHRSLIVFCIGIAVLGISIPGTKRLFARSK